MVAADIDTKSAAVSSSMTSSPNCRNTATSSVNIGASRLPAGIPSTGQHTVSAAMTSGPYTVAADFASVPPPWAATPP